MTNFLFVLIGLISSIPLSGQTIIFPYLIGDNFSWDQIEKPTSYNEKVNLLSAFPKEHFVNYHRPDFWDMDSVYSSGIHVLDLNADNKLDFIYNGYFPAEGHIIEIYQNTGTAYEKIYTDYQGFLDIEFENGKIKRFIIDNPGCCADQRIRKKIVEITHSKNKIIFKPTYLTEIINGTVLPKTINSNAIEFETINDRYFLRSSPEIKDEPFDEYFEKNGNQLATLSKGTRGRMIAEQSDSTGRVWWFVEIYPQYKLIDNVFYPDQFYKDDDTFRVGWISSRFIKRLQ